jgi:pyrimidine operon attenuation protein / uracil phosphoribosyltransferase
MNPGEQRLCDGHEIVGLISSMARKLVEARRAGVPLYLVGVRSRGVPLAQRLAQELCRLVGENVEVGAVDITLYRDDLGHGQRWPVLLGTDIPFDLEGADVVLVDDVLFTGRTVRAALNAICDLGRPACVRLAVLVDRGHREIPIQPDVVGLHVTTDFRDHVRVRLQPIDPVEEVVTLAAGRMGRPLPRSAKP